MRRALTPWQKFLLRLGGFQEKTGKRAHFQAAKVSRLTSSWVTAPIRQDAAVREDLSVLRARSRELVRDNDYARRCSRLIVGNIVGPKGVTLQSKARNLTGGLDQAITEEIEAKWRDWSKAQHADYSRVLSWRDFQRIAVLTDHIDGEAFFRIHESSWAGEPYRFSIECIDPERIPARLRQTLKAGYYIRGGIEFDAMSRPVAYHIRSDGDSNSVYYEGQSYSRVPAAEIIHYFDPEFAAQTRGYPRMSAGMMSLFHLGGYKEAAIMAARAGAAKMGFIVNPNGEELPSEDTEDDGTPIWDFEPMTLREIPLGFDVKDFDPTYPTGEFPSFIKSCLQAFASSQDVSYNTLANDLEGVSFSALKTGKDDEHNAFECEQERLIERLCDPIFDRWLRRQFINRTFSFLDAPINSPSFDQIRPALWQPHRWQEIDPLKSASADSTRLRDMTTTASEIIRRGGRDPMEVWRERADEIAQMKQLGLDPEKDALPQPQPNQIQKDDE